MKPIALHILALARRSTWFKKYSMGLGSFLLGMLFQERYWREIRATLDTWGVSRDDWHTAAWAIIGVCGVATSVLLSLRMTPEDKQMVADKAAAKAGQP